MGQLSGNSCNIITLLPLGVECESINASTPIVSNGLISIFITGGTPPYSTTWSNGTQGSYLFNLLPGSYTATTTDYYGDFTATTVCTVGAESFYLDKFESCENSSQYVYYLGNTPSNFVFNKIYRLQSLDGCWRFDNQVLFTGQTYFNTSATTLAGPYEKCFECLPPTPTPDLKPNNICMVITETNQVDTTVTNVQFSTGNTINGKQSWTSVTPSLVIYYNSGTTKWSVSGWTYGGNPSQNNTASSPLGTWTIYGSSNTSMELESGLCGVKPIIKVKTNRTTCEGASDGSAVISATNGTPPYLYSLDDVIYVPSNMFIGLSDGNYTAYVKDNLNQKASKNFIITNGSTPVTYTLNLVQNPLPAITTNNISKFTQSTNTVEITVTPPLPSNKILTFDLVHSTTYKKNSGINNNVEIFPTLQYSITSGATSGVQITGYTAPSIGTSVIPLFLCPDANEYLTGSTETYYPVFSGNNTVLTFSIVKKITTPDANKEKCTTYGYIRDTFQIVNPKILNQSKCESFVTPGPLSFETERNGFVRVSKNDEVG